MMRNERTSGSLQVIFLGFIMALTVIVKSAAAQDLRHDVPFLTVRDPGLSDGPGEFFGDARSTLRAGRCMVRRVDTGGLAPILDEGPAFVREQLLQIDEVRILEPADLLDTLQDSETAKPPALFVHGYYIDFDKGCRRAALLQENAKIDGRMIWFSWPSDGDIANYARDEADLYWSVPDIADAIVNLNRRFSATGGVDVIGHSLGGRGVVLALQEIAHRHPDIKLGEVVLLAPDMDFGIFSRMLPHIAKIVQGITIYVSDQDRPLALSAQLHGYARLGQTGNDISSLSGIEVIDVSGLPNESASGHLYHIHNPAVGRDLGFLLNDDLRAHQRSGLSRIGPNSWGFSAE